MEQQTGESAERSQPPQVPTRSTASKVIVWVLWALLGFIIGTVLLFMVHPHGSGGRDLAKLAVCSTRLHGIGQSIALYQHEYDERHPPDLYALIVAGQPTDMLTCRSSSTDPAKTHDRDDVETNCAYVYVAGMGSDSPENLVIAYDLPLNHQQHRARFLRMDGAVFKMPPNDLHFQIQRSNDELARRRGKVR